MNYLSKILATEYADEKIIVQTVTPGMVDTKMAAGMKANSTSAMAVPASSFVSYALKTVGTEQETNAHPKHKIINNLSLIIGDLIGETAMQKLLLSVNRRVKESSEKKVMPMAMDNPLSENNLNNA